MRYETLQGLLHAFDVWKANMPITLWLGDKKLKRAIQLLTGGVTASTN